MARNKLSDRPIIVVEAHKLIDIAKQEGLAYRTVQRRKDRFATVLIQVGGKKIQKRYLDSTTTALLRAS